MGLLIFLITILVFGFLGLISWARAELPLIQREIAINTRTSPEGPSYRLAQLLSTLMKVTAVILWSAGVLLAIITLAADGNLVGAIF